MTPAQSRSVISVWNWFLFYTVRQKIDHRVLIITSPNTDWFSKFFHWNAHQKICNKVIIKDPTTSETRCYTTLRNINVGKLATVVQRYTNFFSRGLHLMWSCSHRGPDPYDSWALRQQSAFFINYKIQQTNTQKLSNCWHYVHSAK